MALLVGIALPSFRHSAVSCFFTMSNRVGNRKRRLEPDDAVTATAPASAMSASASAPCSSLRHAQLVEWLLKIYSRGPSLCTIFATDPATGIAVPATFCTSLASPRSGCLVLRCLSWHSRKALTLVCTALHRIADRYWSFSERDRNVIVANSLREYYGIASQNS